MPVFTQCVWSGFRSDNDDLISSDIHKPDQQSHHLSQRLQIGFDTLLAQEVTMSVCLSVCLSR